MPNEDKYLDIQNIDAGYGRSQVLFGVTLGVPWRGGVAILGRNGSGKTTFITPSKLKQIDRIQKEKPHQQHTK